jgi:hypothetical protein
VHLASRKKLPAPTHNPNKKSKEKEVGGPARPTPTPPAAEEFGEFAAASPPHAEAEAADGSAAGAGRRRRGPVKAVASRSQLDKKKDYMFYPGTGHESVSAKGILNAPILPLWDDRQGTRSKKQENTVGV